MLRQFHFIDVNGKDQGINVRNRAKELADLLGDVERIRAERKKARSTRTKYSGLEGGSSFGSSGGGGRYGGFGSDDLSFGGYSGGVYGDGGGFGGGSSGVHGSSGRRDRFEEYDEGDDEPASTSTRRPGTSSSARKAESSKAVSEPAKPKAPEVDLLSVDDELPSTTIPASSSSGNRIAKPQSANNTTAVPQSKVGEDDDFDDFQSAAPTAQTAASQILPLSTLTSSGGPGLMAPLTSPKFGSGGQGLGLNNLVASSSVSSTPSNTSSFASPPATLHPASQPATYHSSQPNYFTSVPVAANQPGMNSMPTRFSNSTPATSTRLMNGKQPSTAKPVASSSGDAFGSLWSSASANIKKSSSPTPQGPNLASMAKEKASAGIWAVSSTAPQAGGASKPKSSGQSTLNSKAPSSKAGGDLDDLLA